MLQNYRRALTEGRIFHFVAALGPFPGGGLASHAPIGITGHTSDRKEGILLHSKSNFAKRFDVAADQRNIAKSNKMSTESTCCRENSLAEFLPLRHPKSERHGRHHIKE